MTNLVYLFLFHCFTVSFMQSSQVHPSTLESLQKKNELPPQTPKQKLAGALLKMQLRRGGQKRYEKLAEKWEHQKEVFENQSSRKITKKETIDDFLKRHDAMHIKDLVTAEMQAGKIQTADALVEFVTRAKLVA